MILSTGVDPEPTRLPEAISAQPGRAGVSISLPLPSRRQRMRSVSRKINDGTTWSREDSSSSSRISAKLVAHRTAAVMRYRPEQRTAHDQADDKANYS